MSSKRKPVVIDTRYEITLVETPPPGPPKYELIDAWPPNKHLRKTIQKSKAPIIISLIALLIAIFSITMSLGFFVPYSRPTYVVTTTLTSKFTTTNVQTSTMTTTTTSIFTYTTTVVTVQETQVPGSCVLIDSQMNIRLVNLTFVREKNQLLFDVLIDSQKRAVDKVNFTIRYRNYGTPSDEKYGEIQTIEGIDSSRYRVNSTIPDLAESISIIDIIIINGTGENCTIARFYG
jgi:hypothetical protein